MFRCRKSGPAESWPAALAVGEPEQEPQPRPFADAQLDYPVVQGCLLFTALSYVVINLIVDLCYPFFDPRVTAA